MAILLHSTFDPGLFSRVSDTSSPDKSPPGQKPARKGPKPAKGVRSPQRGIRRPPSDEATKFHFILNNSRLYIAFIRFVFDTNVMLLINYVKHLFVMKNVLGLESS